MSNVAPARAQRLRITRTDACGVPVAEATANSRVTTEGFVSVGLAAETRTSSDIEVPNAAGGVCVYSKGVTSLLGFNVTLELCDFNLAMLEMTLGTGVLTDTTDVGGVINADGSFNAATVMVEWWSDNAKNDACAAGGDPYIHFLLPRVNRWVLSGNTDFGDTATTVTLEAYAEPTAAFAPSRAVDGWTAADITAINANGVLAWRTTNILPTAVAEGYDI